MVENDQISPKTAKSGHFREYFFSKKRPERAISEYRVVYRATRAITCANISSWLKIFRKLLGFQWKNAFLGLFSSFLGIFCHFMTRFTLLSGLKLVGVVGSAEFYLFRPKNPEKSRKFSKNVQKTSKSRIFGHKKISQNSSKDPNARFFDWNVRDKNYLSNEWSMSQIGARDGMLWRF